MSFDLPILWDQVSDCDSFFPFHTYYGSEFINAELIVYCEREKITFTRGRPYRKNDQCYVEQKNGIVVKQFVGYDRFEGLRAYKQLTELYRAVHLYINFFQPSMKLREKHRKSSNVNRKYHPARTLFQRLIDSGVIDTKMLEKLNCVNHTLDPVRLVKQIEALQNALWQHAVLITHPSESPDSEDNHNLRFNVKTCSLSGKPAKAGVNPVINAEVRNKRNYRRTKKTKIPRYWCTRKDPYENVRGEVYKWLENNPERTATSLLLGLQQRYPGLYNNNCQIRFKRRLYENSKEVLERLRA